MSTQIKYKLNNWALISSGDPFIAPELRRQFLIGEVEGHSHWPDGHVIVTSWLMGQSNGRIITKSGSSIELGEPKADYNAMFPDARKRLFATAPMVVELH